MSKREMDSARLITFPLWQVMLVLVGFPSLYVANSLLPWSIGLLHRHDHAFFLQFWVSIAVLHWGSVVVVLLLLRRASGRLADIGLVISPLGAAAMICIPVLVGVALTVLHQVSAVNQAKPSDPSTVVSPATLGERIFWIFMSMTAGICEELVYRGFCIRMLQRRQVPTLIAVVLATLAFVFIHGTNVMAPVPFLTIFVAGLLFSALFLWRRSLIPGICLHALIDLLAIGVPR
jgi:uncharacterized protein